MLYSPLDFESPPWDTLSGDAREVVQGLLQRDAGRRLTTLEALRHRSDAPPPAAAGSGSGTPRRACRLCAPDGQRLTAVRWHAA